MTPETASVLARALQTRWAAESILIGLVKTAGTFGSEVPPAITQSIQTAGETYVHEQRIINRIVWDETDPA